MLLVLLLLQLVLQLLLLLRLHRQLHIIGKLLPAGTGHTSRDRQWCRPHRLLRRQLRRMWMAQQVDRLYLANEVFLHAGRLLLVRHGSTIHRVARHRLRRLRYPSVLVLRPDRLLLIGRGASIHRVSWPRLWRFQYRSSLHRLISWSRLLRRVHLRRSPTRHDVRGADWLSCGQLHVASFVEVHTVPAAVAELVFCIRAGDPVHVRSRELVAREAMHAGLRLFGHHDGSDRGGGVWHPLCPHVQHDAPIIRHAVVLTLQVLPPGEVMHGLCLRLHVRLAVQVTHHTGLILLQLVPLRLILHGLMEKPREVKPVADFICHLLHVLSWENARDVHERSWVRF
mmetsp:Transcript_492/g.1148  ORF Transcript_492/g.1148 Transcript_492/m.1148 type:complete len:340 (+) Transcript_492:628-1647(+)